jgi:GNAT superfamily N-acetyltransferase
MPFHQGDFFWGAHSTADGEESTLVGLVCGTLCCGSTLLHETMHEHDPAGTTLCIHSVVVAAAHRRRGIASAMLRAYSTAVAALQPQVTLICLIAKAQLLHLYTSCGFSLKGPSSVVHGADAWFELRMQLQDCEPRALPWLLVDAFTAQPFGGNPAAVVFVHGAATWMQAVATEMNQSETAFLQLQDDEGSGTSAIAFTS